MTSMLAIYMDRFILEVGFDVRARKAVLLGAVTF